MNPKDLAEIKRRLNPDKRNPTLIRGCYIGQDGSVISAFRQPVHNLSESDNEKYMALFRRALSGTQGQNLMPIDFPTAAVTDGEAHHALLTKLRDTELKDDDTVDAIFTAMIDGLMNDPNRPASGGDEENTVRWLLLLLYDGYDVPSRTKNDEVDHDNGTDVFRYVIGCVCPVKPSRESLSYFHETTDFHTRDANWNVSAPEAGFMFPAFENRGANIYGALYYTRDMSDLHETLMDRLFGVPPLMPASEQKETFQTVLQASLQDECSMEVVQAVQETIGQMADERKSDKNAEPLSLNKAEIKNVLQGCGVSEEKAEAFEQQYAESFGEYTELPAVNLVSGHQFKIATPSVQITVDPEHSDLVETRMIDGKRYIMVLADGDVMVNGMMVNG